MPALVGMMYRKLKLKQTVPKTQQPNIRAPHPLLQALLQHQGVGGGGERMPVRKVLGHAGGDGVP